LISKGRVIRTGLFFALINFLVTIGIGLLLRYHYWSPINQFADRHWIHAHSHVGFLGWIFMALITTAFAMLVPKDSRVNRYMYRLLIYLQLSVLGMLITFPLLGYAGPSIFFSTAHMVLSLVFVVFFFNHTDAKNISVNFLRAGLIFMLISSIGPLALGPMMAMDLKGTPIYNFAVYFYLHFQYNAWLTLAIFGLIIKLLETLGFPIKQKIGKLVLNLLIYASVFTLALSALGFDTIWYVRAIGSVGVFIQLWAGILFLIHVWKDLKLARSLSNTYGIWFIGIALFAWLLKIMLQFISVIPFVTEFIWSNREAVMTYLHLAFLGFGTSFLLGIMILKKFLSVTNVIARLGYWMFIFGIVTMELTMGVRSFPQFLNLNAFQTIKLLLLIEAFILFTSLIFILFYGFVMPKRKVILMHH